VPRKPRAWTEHGIYHLFSRGSNRQAIFLAEPDYQDFAGLLDEALRLHGIDVFAWALMPNHWHLMARSPTGGLSTVMQRVNHRHALRFDKRWGRRAHLFENRFGAVLQESEEQLLWTLRYVVRNPVEAGLWASPADARWTSYAATAGRESAPAYLRVDEILGLFGSDVRTARARYVDFVLGPSPGAPVSPALAEPMSVVAA
jgi:putative transposase